MLMNGRMTTGLHRRGILVGLVVWMTSLTGCLQPLLSGCEDQSKYLLKLTEVEENAVRTNPIAFQNLSANERRLVRKTVERGRYETCPQRISDEDSRALFAFRDRVQSHRSNGYAFLDYEGRYFQIGLVLSAVHYARTEHPPSQSEPTADR